MIKTNPMTENEIKTRVDADLLRSVVSMDIYPEDATGDKQVCFDVRLSRNDGLHVPPFYIVTEVNMDRCEISMYVMLSEIKR